MPTLTGEPNLPGQKFPAKQVMYAAAILLVAAVGPFLLWPILAHQLLSSNFVPHFYCYLGKAGLIWTHVAADSLIGLSYLAISGTLAYLVYKSRRDIPFHWMFLAFGLFIVACGGTHFMEVLTIWIPVYVFSAAVKVFTAVVSVGTAILLPFMVPQILDLIKKAKSSELSLEKLRLSEERFRLMVTEVKDYAIFMLDPKGYVLSWNLGAERIKGYCAQEIIGKHFSQFYPPAEAERGKPQYELESAAKQDCFTEEGWRVRKDGSRFWASITITALHDEHGILRGFGKLTRDMTERKRTEDEMHIRNAQLEVANKELQSFSYSVSHDLRAPLRTIDGFSMAIMEDYGDKLDAEGHRHLQRIRAAATRMGHLIDDMLKLARITRLEMTHNETNLSRLAEEIAENLKRSNPERDVEFLIAPGLQAHCDRNLLRAALENLLGNAWKFTTNRSRARIELGMEKREETEVYFVRDNGAGFDMRYAGKLFGVFQRLHNESEFPGTGVGLATVQRIIHRHGGKVWAEAAVGKGATFYFVLKPETGAAAA